MPPCTRRVMRNTMLLIAVCLFLILNRSSSSTAQESNAVAPLENCPATEIVNSSNSESAASPNGSSSVLDELSEKLRAHVPDGLKGVLSRVQMTDFEGMNRMLDQVRSGTIANVTQLQLGFRTQTPGFANALAFTRGSATEKKAELLALLNDTALIYVLKVKALIKALILQMLVLYAKLDSNARAGLQAATRILYPPIGAFLDNPTVKMILG